MAGQEPQDDLDLLHPTLKRKVLAVLSDLRGHGFTPVVFETKRSVARQRWLVANGRSWIKHSSHQDGTACDIVSLKGGKPTWDNPPFFAALKSSALAHNLRGYKGTKSFSGDACHVQLAKEDM